MPAASLAMPDIAYQYLPILLFIGVGIAFSVIFVGAPVIVSKRP